MEPTKEMIVMTANKRTTKMIERDADAQIMDALSLSPEDVALIGEPVFGDWVVSVEAEEAHLLREAEEWVESQEVVS